MAGCHACSTGLQKPNVFLIFLPGLFCLVPLAGTVQRLLKVVLHECGIAGAVKCDGASLQSTLTAALTEPGVTVDVKVEYGGRRAFPIAGIHCHLKEEGDRRSLKQIMS